MDYIRIAILGAAGMRGKQLAKLFSQPDQGIIVTMVADTDRETLLRVYNWYNDTTPFPEIGTSIDDILISDHVDVIVIATPDYLHEEHACTALAAGKHVYLEKPMAITPEGCDRIIQAARQHNRTLYVGHNLRHFTVIKKLKDLIDDGRIGTVKSVWCRHPVSYGQWAYFAPHRWHRDRENTGSLLIHKGSHDLDVIHWLAGGRTVRVVAMGPGDDASTVESSSSVLMQLNNGVQATYCQSTVAFLACREYMILGSEGTICNNGDNPETATVQLFGKRSVKSKSVLLEEFRFSPEDGFHGDADLRTIDEFLGILRGTVVPTISIEDAAWAVKTGFAATQSLRNGSMPVDVT